VPRGGGGGQAYYGVGFSPRAGPGPGSGVRSRAQCSKQVAHRGEGGGVCGCVGGASGVGGGSGGWARALARLAVNKQAPPC
jgi:hypothetical protein